MFSRREYRNGGLLKGYCGTSDVKVRQPIVIEQLEVDKRPMLLGAEFSGFRNVRSYRDMKGMRP